MGREELRLSVSPLSRARDARRRTTVVAAVCAFVVASMLVLVPTTAVHADLTNLGYCAKVTKILDSNTADKAKTPREAVARIQATAKAFRASNPPANLKKPIDAYAALLDKQAAALKLATQADFASKLQEVIGDPAFLTATQNMVIRVARSCH